MGPSLLRLFLRQPVVVFCMLVVVLDLDCVTGSRGGAGKRDVLLVARLGIDASIGLRGRSWMWICSSGERKVWCHCVDA